MLLKRYAFGDFLLDAEAGTLLRKGAPIPVPYRALLVLTALVQQPGNVVSKSALIDAAWPGLAVEEGNLSVQIAALRKILGDGTDGGEFIATVPRVGYRFTSLVDRSLDETRKPVVPEPPDGPSLAVLPFANLSDDPEQQYFADGLAEDLITRLSRLRWLFLSARNSSFTYQGRAVDVKRVGRELGVRYVLSGSVRRSGHRLRVTAQLNDAAAGSQVWADRYDAQLSDFFELQDAIAESVMAAIEPQLYAAENNRLRSRPPESLDAWGYVMRAMPMVWTWGAAEEIAMAEALLVKALSIIPQYARATSLLAWTRAARAHLGQDDPGPVLTNAEELARQAVLADPHDSWTHFAAGYVHMVSRAFHPAVERLQEAISLNSSLALAHTILGSTYAYNGMAEEGLHHLDLAVRLGPRDYNEAANHSTIGLCHFMNENFAEAASCNRRAVQLRPLFVTAWRSYAASAALAGDLDNARHALGVSKNLQPSLTLSWVDRYHPIVQPRHRALYMQGLRDAGLR